MKNAHLILIYVLGVFIFAYSKNEFSFLFGMILSVVSGMILIYNFISDGDK